MNGKWKAFLILGVMFGLGAVSGVTWQRSQSHHWGNRGGQFAEHRVKRMTEKLKLSEEQANALRAIFQTAHARATQVNEEVSWDLADIHRDSVKEIRKILKPEQLQEFEKMHEKYHSRHKNLLKDDDDSTKPANAQADGALKKLREARRAYHTDRKLIPDQK